MIKHIQFLEENADIVNKNIKSKTDFYNYFIILQEDINKDFNNKINEIIKDFNNKFEEINKETQEIKTIYQKQIELFQKQTEQIDDLKRENEMLMETVKQYHKKEIKK